MNFYMNLRDLFAKFTWYPKELVVHDTETDTTTKVEDYAEQDILVCNNGNREVLDFLVSYNPDRLWVNLGGILNNDES